jgi:hypothetical protein
MTAIAETADFSVVLLILSSLQAALSFASFMPKIA